MSDLASMYPAFDWSVGPRIRQGAPLGEQKVKNNLELVHADRVRIDDA
jgi:hypothetical protein